MAVFTGTTIEEAKEKARTQLKPTLIKRLNLRFFNSRSTVFWELDDAKRKWMQ